ncbi:MAG: N-acetylmuramoyl-L-alanine amidase [Bacteroidales bacterium]|nr:N-acetylmuramoyl-L-alanine amidase [Bacteroidales bacterium]
MYSSPLGDRAEIANKADANLFISLHVNACPRSGPSGYSVHVLGQSSAKDRDLFAFNRDICRRENSVIYLEEDYSTRYEGFDPNDEESYIFMLLMQNAYLEQSIRFAAKVDANMKTKGPFPVSRGLSQDPFFVLWKTAMPSVLVEMGFISNAGDLEKLRTESAKDKIAESLFSAIMEYRKEYDESISTTK